jgi:hypothetical protein
VAPEDNSNSAEHSANTLKERVREGFANGWAEGWHQRDFQKQTMSHVEICEKCCPTFFLLQGYLTDQKRSYEQYQPLQEDLLWRIKFLTRLSSTMDRTSFYGQRSSIHVSAMISSPLRRI